MHWYICIYVFIISVFLFLICFLCIIYIYMYIYIFFFIFLYIYIFIYFLCVWSDTQRTRTYCLFDPSTPSSFQSLPGLNFRASIAEINNDTILVSRQPKSDVHTHRWQSSRQSWLRLGIQLHMKNIYICTHNMCIYIYTWTIAIVHELVYIWKYLLYIHAGISRLCSLTRSLWLDKRMSSMFDIYIHICMYIICIYIYVCIDLNLYLFIVML